MKQADNFPSIPTKLGLYLCLLLPCSLPISQAAQQQRFSYLTREERSQLSLAEALQVQREREEQVKEELFRQDPAFAQRCKQWEVYLQELEEDREQRALEREEFEERMKQFTERENKRKREDAIKQEAYEKEWEEWLTQQQEERERRQREPAFQAPSPPLGSAVQEVPPPNHAAAWSAAGAGAASGGAAAYFGVSAFSAVAAALAAAATTYWYMKPNPKPAPKPARS